MGIEISEDEHLAWKASSDAFANPVQEVLERGQAAVRRNINAHHRHSIPLDRDIVEHNARGRSALLSGLWLPIHPVGGVRDAIRLSHYREGDLALPDSLEEQVLRPSRPSQVTLEEPLEFIGPTPWPPPGHLRLLRRCCLAFLPPPLARGRVVSSWFWGGAHATPPILWLAGAPSDSHRGHLGVEAGQPLARCPISPHL